MKNKWLICILLVGAFFRFFHLTQSPPGLNWDEVSIGYNAYSVFKTGHDEWGKFLPLSFKAFGEQKLPGMIYASIPGIAILGETDMGVRITPAIIGMIAILLIYLLAKKLLSSESIALAAAALLAISPWAVHFSRVSFEAGLAMLFVMASIYSLPRLWPSMLFAILAAYTYNSVRILLPLLGTTYLVTGVIAVTRQNSKKLLMVLLVGVLACLPIILELHDPAGRVRWGTVSITNQKSFIDTIAESRSYTMLPAPLPRLLHNKVTHYIYALGSNYVRLFSTEFLFLKGGENTQRSIQGMGLLYLFEFPFLIVGLSSLLKKDTKFAHVKRLLLPWLLLAPIPSILTIDSPSTVRALNMLPPLLLIEALGASSVFTWLKTHRLIRVFFGIFIAWNVCYFGYLLFSVYPIKYSDKWVYGYKEAVLFGQAQYAEATHLYLTAKYGEPYIYTLFYSHYDPAKFQHEQVEKEVDPTGWVHVKAFDKYIFTDFSGLEAPLEIVSRQRGMQVLVTGFTQLPPQYERMLHIQAPNWEVMFEGTVQRGEQ